MRVKIGYYSQIRTINFQHARIKTDWQTIKVNRVAAINRRMLLLIGVNILIRVANKSRGAQGQKDKINAAGIGDLLGM